MNNNRNNLKTRILKVLGVTHSIHTEVDDTSTSDTMSPMIKSESDIGSIESDYSLDLSTLSMSPIPIKRRVTLEGPSALIPVGDLCPKKRGRFSISREEVTSSQWAPKSKTIDRPSRFYH